MKYISLDLETTGLDPRKDQVLQIAAVAADSEDLTTHVERLPFFNCYVEHSRIEGDPKALVMNAELLKRIYTEEGVRHVGSFRAHEVGAWNRFENWLLNYLKLQSGKIVLAGKNVGKFDYQFMPPDVQRHFHHRFIDPGSVFIDWSQPTVMGLDALLQKTGHGCDRVVTHDALEDARDVVSVLRQHRMNCQ